MATQEPILLRDDAKEIDLGMSNFDHTIDDGFASALQAQPCAVYGRHASWNFNGKVWFDGHHFVEWVWQWGRGIELLTADTLEELMQRVNTKYGSE